MSSWSKSWVLSASCPFELRRSPQSLLAAPVLAALLVLALHLCALPGWLKLLLLATVLGWAGRHLWQQWQRLPQQLRVPYDPNLSVLLDEHEIDEFQVIWRGPLVLLRWRQQGLPSGCLLWPDQLSPALRRELRLAMLSRAIPRNDRSMAP